MSTVNSWGRLPHTQQRLKSCHWTSELLEASQQLQQQQINTLAFGNGRSYGDSCTAESRMAIGMRQLNRFIAADWQSGVVTAEAGVTLGEILNLSIPRGWFLPVTPGTQFVTLGGAVANDVHGKNHHIRGTFGCSVTSFNLLRQGQWLTCSATENAQLFSATIGGLGLTGIIGQVSLQLMPIHSAQINGYCQRFNNLDEFFQLSSTYDAQYEYSVAWVDCLAKGDQLGRGVYIVGNHAAYGDLSFTASGKKTVPFTPPFSLVNRLTLKPFNQLYWYKHPKAWTAFRSEYDPFFYPLDAILHWNKMYGNKGFQQYQCVIPENSAPEAIHELLSVISSSGIGSFLAVLKRCGEIASPGLLSFPMPGTSLALDFPQSAKLHALFKQLDSIVAAAQGRLYPAKDAHWSAQHFKQGFPEWELLEQLREPHLNSLFWKRVTQ